MRAGHVGVAVRRRLIAIIIVSALTVVVISSGDGAGAAAPPARWDSRIKPIAQRVERLRGLRFEHPVPVVFTTKKQFRRLVKEQNRSGLASLGKKRVYREEIILRALGLMNAGWSLEELQAPDLRNVLAFYDVTRKRIVVRGHDVGVATEVTLAHELTHTLQDQHFDLETRQDRAKTLDAAQALTALVEGDAMRIASAYLGLLSAGEREGVANAEPDGVSSSTSGAPWAAFAAGGAPYLFGPLVVGGIGIDKGERGVDLAFRAPPAHQVEVVNPHAALGRFLSVPTSEPDTRKGERRVGPNAPIGAMTLYAALASRIDAPSAMFAADEWGGSSAVAFLRDGEACVRAEFRAEFPDGSARLADAIRAWTEFGPAGTSSMSEASGAITLVSCSKIGMSDDLGPVDEAALMLAFRNQLMLSSFAEGVHKEVARCVADELISDEEYLTEFGDLGAGEGHTPAQLEWLNGRVEEKTEYCESFDLPY